MLLMNFFFQHAPFGIIAGIMRDVKLSYSTEDMPPGYIYFLNNINFRDNITTITSLNALRSFMWLRYGKKKERKKNNNKRKTKKKERFICHKETK